MLSDLLNRCVIGETQERRKVDGPHLRGIEKIARKRLFAGKLNLSLLAGESATVPAARRRRREPRPAREVCRRSTALHLRDARSFAAHCSWRSEAREYPGRSKWNGKVAGLRDRENFGKRMTVGKTPNWDCASCRPIMHCRSRFGTVRWASRQMSTRWV